MKIQAYSYNNEELVAEEILNFPSNCPFGNLSLKYALLMQKIHSLNEIITEIASLDALLLSNRNKRLYSSSELSSRSLILKMRLSSEVKIYTDEMISLINILDYHFYYLIVVFRRAKNIVRKE